MRDLFDKIREDKGPLGNYSAQAEGYFIFPKLEGELSSRMKFRGHEVIVWSINDYLGLSNNEEVRKADLEGAQQYGLAYPMGSRLMSGHTDLHEELERRLAKFERKEAAFLLNFGYQGMVSGIESLVSRNDVIVYDAEAHACIIDGVHLHQGKRFAYKHNDIESLRTNLRRATNLVKDNDGGILVISEGVFGMSGVQGKLKEIVALKEEFNFRFMIDDAHAFGVLGETGAGTSEAQGVMDGVDIYFGAFAKAMAGVGGFFAGDKDVINYLKYNMRSQIYAKALPMAMVVGSLKRLDMIENRPELRERLHANTATLQNGLREKGFRIGETSSCVTPVFLEGDVQEAMAMVFDLRNNYHIFCSIVIYPVVPKGTILLRLIPTATHTLADIEETIEAFSAIRDKLKNGTYKKAKVDISAMTAEMS
ncbi:pyridoxal phosphate-dependent aminotransferase family protein [Chitinophaga sp. HK235]|uniref:aminotransferase class I/II-fold pyridoxal phosphate-dependent enzyme n=1 Tax=Chitinophaga sp. HK235 TaxID=2952571 RepID=UPI001BAD8134|nr:pyridoxal phosphate-dependent aminotransferase family protein [Chitinophaga sp. HK235]